MPDLRAPFRTADQLIAAGLRPRTAKAPPEDLVEDLARWLAPNAFEERRRSPKTREIAALNRKRARTIARLALRFRPIAEALAANRKEAA